jgi:hypothetical protein
VRLLVGLFFLIAASGTTQSQVFFPLHVGDMWVFEDRYSAVCEGTSIIYLIVGDTVLNGRTYARFFNYSPFSGPLVRADSMRVYEYDTAAHSEYVVFDFSAKPGDTVSIRNNGAKVTIALGAMRFSVGRTTYTVRDSIGVISWYDAVSLCSFDLTSARIDGTQIYTGVLSNDKRTPERALLEQNFPNPFNPTTTIRYGLPHRSHVAITVFNTLGQQVSQLRKGEVDAGYHEVRFDGSGLPSGVYFCRMQTEEFVQTKKLVLVR